MAMASSSTAPTTSGAASGGGATDCGLVLRLPAVSDISLSACGLEVALATRQGTFLTQLEHRPEPPHVRHWRVAGPTLNAATTRVAFSPHAAARRQLAVCSGRTVSIVDIGPDDGGVLGPPQEVDPAGGVLGVVKASFSAHLRPVNALDWSPSSPHLLATCGEDCRFFIWDLREPQLAQTLLSPASWTCAVRWAALDDNMLATGHEDTVCVWDRRNPSQQMNVLAPGQSRVLGVDWSLHERGKLLSVSAQQGANASCSGFIKVWDVASAGRLHQSIDIENGLPGAARFLPFGPAILAAVDSDVVVFGFQPGGSRLARVLREFKGHTAPVDCVAFAQPEGAAAEWRFVSLSSAERCLRSWNFTLPQELQSTVVRLTPCSSASVAPHPLTPRRSPALGPRPPPYPLTSPGLPPGGPRLQAPGAGLLRTSSRPAVQDEKELHQLFLGGLATQAKRLRQLPCVVEVTSFQQAVAGRGSEYQLLIEVETTNGIRLSITIGVDPGAHATRRAAAALWAAAAAAAEAPNLGAGPGVRFEVKWADEWAGTFDGPLTPGVIEDSFRNIDLVDMFSGGDDLPERVGGLVRILHRRDGPPLLAGVAAVAAEAAPAGPSRRADELPFPRTCGVCWSPHGDLLCFRSLQRIHVPGSRQAHAGVQGTKWTSTDYRRVLKIHQQQELRTLLRDADDKHTAAALHMRVATTVHAVPTRALCEAVEDHWWTATAHLFLFEPSPAAPTVRDVCVHNAAACVEVGREDLAEVWRMTMLIADGAGGTLEGLRSRPFATRLVRQMLCQLFDAQETLTVAMVGSVLLCLGDGPEGQGSRGSGADFGDRCADSAMAPGDSDGLGRSGRARGARRRGPSGPSPTAASEAELLTQGSLTWSPNITAAADYARAVRTLARVGEGTSGGAKASRSEHNLPRSADNTVNQSTFPRELRAPPLRSSRGSAARPIIHYAPPSEGLLDLLPRDERTLERLLHSAHAHCDIMHRLGEFHAARALAKVMKKLEAFHGLPLLDPCTSTFGGPPRAPLPPASTLPAAWEAHEATSSATPALLSSASGGHSVAVCAVCRVRARSLYAPCWNCHHGFHVPCLQAWFGGAPDRLCPAIGCDCRCAQHRALPAQEAQARGPRL